MDECSVVVDDHAWYWWDFLREGSWAKKSGEKSKIGVTTEWKFCIINAWATNVLCNIIFIIIILKTKNANIYKENAEESEKKMKQDRVGEWDDDGDHRLKEGIITVVMRFFLEQTKRVFLPLSQKIHLFSFCFQFWFCMSPCHIITHKLVYTFLS